VSTTQVNGTGKRFEGTLLPLPQDKPKKEIDKKIEVLNFNKNFFSRMTYKLF